MFRLVVKLGWVYKIIHVVRFSEIRSAGVVGTLHYFIQYNKYAVTALFLDDIAF